VKDRSVSAPTYEQLAALVAAQERMIAQLLECGLVRPSFVPPPDIRRLRMLTRFRVRLMGDRTREVARAPAKSWLWLGDLG